MHIWRDQQQFATNNSRQSKVSHKISPCSPLPLLSAATLQWATNGLISGHPGGGGGFDLGEAPDICKFHLPRANSLPQKATTVPPLEA